MEKNILEFFEKNVSRNAEKTAIVDGDRTINFGDLDFKARSLGTFILRKNEEIIRRPVGVFIAKSIESIYADIAAVYSGNAYMNLDVNTPMARIENILSLVKPAYVITDKKHYDKLAEHYDKDCIIVIDDMELPEPDNELLTRRQDGMIDTDLFCLINTSGSTGTPKSVALCHKSFIDYTLWAIECVGIQEDEIFGSLAPIVFDHSSYELCLLMTRGCTMVMLPETYASFPAKLMQYVAEMKVTYIFWVPTIMVNIANMDLLARIPQPTLRMIWFAGEVFPTKQFNYWRKHLPNATFVNLYGPTEITVDCTYYVVNRELSDDEPIPIGNACRNTDIIILNAENKPVKPGEEGELCVRGTSLALGYYNNPEKTAAAFVQNPLNSAYPEVIYRTGDIVYTNEAGEIVFKGRNDTLIKHMSKRIELGEIEHVLINTLQIVRYGCVVYDYDKKEIVFYYEEEGDLTVAQLRKAAASALPKYMIPSRFVSLEELPRNTNGKIDRLKLKNMLAQ